MVFRRKPPIDETFHLISRAEAMGHLSFGDARLFCLTASQIRQLPEIVR